MQEIWLNYWNLAVINSKLKYSSFRVCKTCLQDFRIVFMCWMSYRHIVISYFNVFVLEDTECLFVAKRIRIYVLFQLG